MTDMLYLKRIVHAFHSKHVVDTETCILSLSSAGLRSGRGSRCIRNWNIWRVVVSAIREGQGATSLQVWGGGFLQVALSTVQ